MIVIDGMSEFYRNYYALCRNIGPQNAGFFGAVRAIMSYKSAYGDDEKIVIVWEGKSTLRQQIDSNYKATRKSMKGNFYEQVEDCKQFLSHFFDQYKVEEYEADDMLATIAMSRYAKGKKTTIVTGDDDLHQVINERISVYQPIKKMTYDLNHLKYTEVEPTQLILLWALQGDGSDNIPGIKGLRKKEEMAKLFKGPLMFEEFKEVMNTFYLWHIRLIEENIDEKILFRIYNERANIIQNMNLIRLRKVPKEKYTKIEKQGEPRDLIEKYGAKTLYKYLQGNNDEETLSIT